MSDIKINHPTDDVPDNTQTWTTEQLREDFDVIGFGSPFVVVRRKVDGVKGSLQFTGPTHARQERTYWGFQPA